MVVLPLGMSPMVISHSLWSEPFEGQRMKRPKKSRKPRDLWGAAQSTSMSAKLLVTSSAPLISIQPGTSLVIDGERVTVESIQKGDGRFTITAKADES